MEAVVIEIAKAILDEMNFDVKNNSLKHVSFYTNKANDLLPVYLQGKMELIIGLLDHKLMIGWRNKE